MCEEFARLRNLVDLGKGVLQCIMHEEDELSIYLLNVCFIIKGETTYGDIKWMGRTLETHCCILSIITI